jgi:acetyl-CoA acetyltransferase
VRSGGAIVGIGETRVGKHPGRSALELQAEAVRRALADAHLEKEDIDELYTLASYVTPILLHGLSLTEYMGIRPRFEGNFDIGGTVVFATMAEYAIAAIEEGRSDVAVCVYGDNASTGRAPGGHGFVHHVAQGTEDWEDPYGCTILASYALLARRYLDLYGLDPEKAFFPVMRAARRWAALNENAAYRDPITLEDYRNSRMIADPLRRLDSSPVVDGAGAFVIASERVIKKKNIPHVPISVRGVATRATHKIVSQMPDIPELGLAEASGRAIAEAGISLDDVDLFTMHDGFTHSILIALEAVGFCPPGKAGEFVADGGIEPGGKLPVNTHGGLLAQGHVGGVLHVLEAVRQLRGDAGARQIKDAEVAVVGANGGVYSITGAMVLGKGM